MASCNENNFCKCSDIISGEVTDESFLMCLGGVSGGSFQAPASDVLEYFESNISDQVTQPEGTYLISFDSDGNFSYVERNEYREFLLDEQEFLIGGLLNTGIESLGKTTFSLNSDPPAGLNPTHALISTHTYQANTSFVRVLDENLNTLHQHINLSGNYDSSSITNSVKAPIHLNESTGKYELTINILRTAGNTGMRIVVIGFVNMTTINGDGVISNPLSSSDGNIDPNPLDIIYFNHTSLSGGFDQTVVEWITDPNLISPTDIYNVSFDFGNGEITTLSASNVTSTNCGIQRMNVFWGNGNRGLILEAQVSSGANVGLIQSSNFGVSNTLNSACETTTILT